MTRAEKEQYVLELYKQNKTIREIAQRTHMSFRDIGIITNKYKKEIEPEKGHLEEKSDYKPKSKTTQAIEMFSEGKTPTEVVIELDLPADKVRTIYRQYLELNGMYDVLQIYDQIRYSGKYSLPLFLKLHRIVSDLEMGEQEIINVLDLANHNQLEYLQGKVEYLSNEVNMLEEEKTNCTKHLLILNKRIDAYMKAMYTYESVLAQRREEMYYTDKGSRILRLDNRTGELTYRQDGMYPMSSVRSTTALTYSEDSLYSNIGDRSIRPLSSNMKLTRRNDYKISDDSDTEVIYATGSWHNIIPYRMK